MTTKVEIFARDPHTQQYVPVQLVVSPDDEAPSIQTGELSFEANEHGTYMTAAVVFTDEEAELLRQATDIKYQGHTNPVVQDFIHSAAVAMARQTVEYHARGQRIFDAMTRETPRLNVVTPFVDLDEYDTPLGHFPNQLSVVQPMLDAVTQQSDEDAAEPRTDVPTVFKQSWPNGLLPEGGE